MPCSQGTYALEQGDRCSTNKQTLPQKHSRRVEWDDDVPSSALGTQEPPNTGAPLSPFPPSCPMSLSIHMGPAHLHSWVDNLEIKILTNSREQEPSSFSHSFSWVHSRCLKNILNEWINESQTLSSKLERNRTWAKQRIRGRWHGHLDETQWGMCSLSRSPLDTDRVAVDTGQSVIFPAGRVYSKFYWFSLTIWTYKLLGIYNNILKWDIRFRSITFFPVSHFIKCQNRSVRSGISNSQLINYCGGRSGTESPVIGCSVRNWKLRPKVTALS